MQEATGLRQQDTLQKRWAELAVLVLGLYALHRIVRYFATPSRPYDPVRNSVGKEYDAWTMEGILEHYWGEHIHLGHYSDAERAAGYKKKGFIQAKFDFIDRMLEFANIADAAAITTRPMKVLDVGCGIGGAARFLAKKFGREWQVTGVTLSPQQVERGKQLANEQGVANVDFHVMDALNMTFQDDTFDVVWACESGEHMPDKGRYIQEMVRVLRPGGTLVVATWCQRDSRAVPLTPAEKAELKFLYDEWTHPYFISLEEYEDIMRDTKQLERIEMADWTPQTLPSWRHSIWVGVWDPWPVIARPSLWVKTLREIVTLSRMHRAFESGLMRYGMFRARKVLGDSPAAA